MNKATCCLFALALAIVLGYAGCTVATALPTPAASSTRTAEATTKEGSQQDWDAVIAGARKEGELSLYWHGGAETQTIVKGFKEKYGLDVQIYNARAPEIAERLSREYSAGIFNADVLLMGWTTVLTVLEPKGLVLPLDNVVTLPEVTDPQKWVTGKFPWPDPGHYPINFGGTINSGIWRNTDLVGPNEIKEHRDLLDPKWKGKIAFNDPTKIGAGSVWFRLYYSVLGEDYMKALIKQDPVVSSDLRLMVEWLARGKYSLTLCGNTENLLQFKAAGAPVEFVETKEGQYISTGPGSLALPIKPPHPNAAKLFINWFLTREGQTAWSRQTLFPSFRVDVPTDHLDPAVVARPGRTYLSDTPETVAQMDKYIQLSKQIFAPILPK